ncbi:MAG: hypothetical protein J7K72_01855, partial [Candidatus Aenigmarchaeota archaeon]|nr:hypothetical protein [Candidatus Aenigmarchaeota archaeon]
KYPMGEQNESSVIESVYKSFKKVVGEKAGKIAVIGLAVLALDLAACNKPPPDENKKVEVPTVTKKVSSEKRGVTKDPMGGVYTKDSTGANIYVPAKLFEGEAERLLRFFDDSGTNIEEQIKKNRWKYKIVCTSIPNNTTQADADLYINKNGKWIYVAGATVPVKLIPNHR